MKTNSRMMVLLMTMVSANVVHGQSNVLPNGDFSASLGILGWTAVGTGSVSYFSSIDADNAPDSGVMVLSYRDSNHPERAVSQCFPVTAGASYRFGGKAEDINAFEVLGAAKMTCSSFSDISCTAGGMSLGSTDESWSTSSFASWIPVSGALGPDVKAAQCMVSTVERIAPVPGTVVGSGAYVDDLFFTLGTSGGPVLLGGYLSGSWYDPDQSGQGFALEFTAQDNSMTAMWFTYSPSGTSTEWIYGGGVWDPSQSSITVQAVLTSGASFPPNFVGANVQKTPWGTLTFEFTDCDHATMSWSSTLPGYESGTQQLRRLTSIAGLSCPQ